VNELVISVLCVRCAGGNVVVGLLAGEESNSCGEDEVVGVGDGLNKRGKHPIWGS
jgi:hypothetical protein